MQALRAARPARLAVQRLAVPDSCAALPAARSRGIVAARPSPAAPETAFGILQLLQENTGPTPAGPGAHGGAGQVLSVTNGLVRIMLPGPVAVGHAVDVGGRLGVVLHYDARCAVAALVPEGFPRNGDSVRVLGPRISLRGLDVPEAGSARAVALPDLLATGGASVLKLPEMPPPQCRRPVTRHMPSGLAAVEALMPLGEGHRVGFVGPPRTGKSAAVDMLMRSQKEDTVCVYATQAPPLRVEQKLEGAPGAAAAVVVIHPGSASPCARYLLPLCAIQAASQLRNKHRHVLLVLDDLTVFAQAAKELGTPPLGAPHVLAAALGAAGAVGGGGRESALSVALVLDMSPEEQLAPVFKGLWRGVEPALDICLSFDGRLAAQGVFPAIGLDQFRAAGFPPPYQAPLLGQLRRQLVEKLRLHHELESKHEMSKQLGLHEEANETESLDSMRVARALFAHGAERPPQELAVLLAAAAVYHFWRPRSAATVTRFQDAVIGTVRAAYPDMWRDLCALDSLSESEANRLLSDLGAALLRHRFDFELTRPEFWRG
mmetsp:Transcript_14729/g.42158  ORF Transcript_14729/g.42158 Transcript_14729/m.42158 type:complete len:546 (+) Transcript_14729:55-1692(+)